MKSLGKIKLSNLSKKEEIRSGEMERIKGGGCTWYDCYCGENWNYETSMPGAVLNSRSTAGYLP